MQNVRLDEAQAGIKIARRNINDIRYADDATLMAESKEELKSLLMKVKEELEKNWLKTQHSKRRSWHLVPWKWKWSLSVVSDSVTPWTVAHQASPSMGFSRQEYWSGLPVHSPGDIPDPGIEPRSPTLQADALTSEPTGSHSSWQIDGETMETVAEFYFLGLQNDCRWQLQPWN